MLIEIRWETGEMQIDPASFLQQLVITRRFRKLLKLSRKSDLLYGTDAVSGWVEALRQEQRRIQETAKRETDLYQRGNDAVRKAHEDPSAPFSEQMDLKAKMEKILSRRKNAYDKRMLALDKRLLRMKKLEEVVSHA